MASASSMLCTPGPPYRRVTLVGRERVVLDSVKVSCTT